MAFIRITANTVETRRKLRKVAKSLTPRAQDMVLQRFAFLWRDRFVRRTPKRWTGSVRKAWTVSPIAAGMARGYRIANGAKVMTYLEYGTRAHGPKNAKRLFIPLTRKAAQAGARGVIHANRQWSLNQAFSVAGTRRKPPFVPGRDFVFAKKVKGIRAMRIVSSSKPFMQRSLTLAMRQYIISIVNGPA